MLPGYKNGNWWIIRSDTNIVLPSSYTSLALFDNKGYILFEDEKSQGILDSNGRALYQSEDQEMTSWGNGLFSFRETEKQWVLDVATGDTLCSSINGFEFYNEQYLRYYQNGDTNLFHIPSRQSWPMNSYLFSYGYFHNSVVCVQDSLKYYVFDPGGNQVELDTVNRNYGFALPYVLDDKQYVLTNTRQIQVPLATANIRVQEPYLSYSDGKLAHLIDLLSDEEIARVPFESIMPFPEGGYIVTKKGKQGLLNETFDLKIPAKYDLIFSAQNYFYVTNSGLTGLIDKNYSLRIPCEFTQIYSDSSFIFTFNDIGMSGLYTVDFKCILATQYDRILVKDRLIKAYKGDKLRIIKLDANDRILSDIILDNAITAKQKIANDAFSFDKRLLPLGWFYERTPIFDSIGIVVKYSTKWGLKSGDSIIAKAKYYTPIFVPDAPFSYSTFKGLKFSLIGISYETQVIYNLINYTSGKFEDAQNYLSFSQNDGIRRNFYRSSTTSGHQIYWKSGEKEKVNYISSTVNRLIPYAKEGKLELVKNTAETVPYGQWLPFNPWGVGLLKGTKYYPLYEKGVQIKDAKWNFLDTNGIDRFEEPFTFANDFFIGTAIAKRAGGWGVVNEDKEIIPFEFSEIKRVRTWNDTVFIVQKPSKKYQFLDSNLTQITTDYASLEKKKNELALLSTRADNALYFQGEEIQTELKNARLINDNFWVLKEKKEFVILDRNATEICRTFNKPVRVLSSDFLLVESKGKRGIIHASGDTILGFGIKEILEFPHYFLVTTKEGTSLYDRDFKLLLKQKSGQKILPNTIKQQYAVIAKQSIKQYDKQNNAFAKTKHPLAGKINQYQNNYFIADQFLMEDTLVINIERDDKLKIYEDGTIQLIKSRESNLFFTETIMNAQFDIPVKNVHYLGSGIVTYVENGERIVKNETNDLKLPSSALPVGLCTDGMCLFASGRRFMYLNENLEIVISKRFEEAKPFENGMACVKSNGAWTLMSTDGQLKSFPSYATITPISTNFFQTKDLPTYGLYDSHGKEIIPAIYEKLIFITPEIIQVVLKGEMGYIDIQGNTIFSILQ